MFDREWNGIRKRRTREHVIEELAVNYFERKVLERGHLLIRAPHREYGWDATLFHFSPETGEIENGEVRIQFKATDKPLVESRHLSCRVETKDLHYWYWEGEQLPFILVAYAAHHNTAYWIDVRSHIDHRVDEIDPHQQSNRLRIPLKNKVTLRTIDQLRLLSLDFI